MKNKLKILFRYFKSLKIEEASTYINLDWKYIDNWQENFESYNPIKNIKLPKFIVEIVYELIDIYEPNFHKYNNYDESEYWTLIIDVSPEDEVLTFRSECEVVVEGLENKWQASITELDSVKGEVYEVFEEVVLTGFKLKPNKEEYLNASVQFFFDGRYDETYIDDVKINNDIIYPDGREFDYLGDLTESVMTLLRNRWWSEGPGTYGTIYVDMSIDLIKVTYTEREREFAPTEMYIQITPENVKNEK